MSVKINDCKAIEWESSENKKMSYEEWQLKTVDIIMLAKKSHYTLDYTSSELKQWVQEYPEFASQSGLPGDDEGIRKLLIKNMGFADQREVYQCERPLKHIPGKGQKNGPDFKLNPVYHQFTCVETAPDSKQYNCLGLGVSKLILGKIESDEFNADLCEPVTKDDAYANCIEAKWEEKPPYYYVGNFGPNGYIENCQAYDDRINKECAQEKEEKKD